MKIRGKKLAETISWSTSSGDSPRFFSSDDEERAEETEKFFSSKSFSLDSAESLRQRRNNNRKAGPRKGPIRGNSEAGSRHLGAIMKGKVEDSVAVVKRFSDPYGDFRSSMVEMIIEKQIFAAKDLEKLLHCFLSLNPTCHHRVTF
ncbi:uncharacterized protein LOC143891660 [Tasmannia lanceolata]|uniref:uncharacterized protein LOC143891660 n=1 Tax=Tasmannia lanceolata TaxID=3420 RepID=UPI004063218B